MGRCVRSQFDSLTITGQSASTSMAGSPEAPASADVAEEEPLLPPQPVRVRASRRAERAERFMAGSGSSSLSWTTAVELWEFFEMRGGVACALGGWGWACGLSNLGVEARSAD